MNESSVKYAIIGGGRMARHFAEYLRLKGVPFTQWTRKEDPEKKFFGKVIERVEYILLLISDAAIEPFIRENNVLLRGKKLVHFSGSLNTDLANGMHPLTAVTNGELHGLEVYEKIPFMCDENAYGFKEVFPDLKNSHFKIKKELKPLYHAYCVISGNFTCILWQIFFNDVENQLNLPKEIVFEYMQQIFRNLKNNPSLALTGPLVRGDFATINNNLAALEGDPVQDLYKAFVEFYNSKSKEPIIAL